MLFPDEPTIGLDVVSKQAVRGFLVELGGTGDITLVLTTHGLADIERLCRRLVVIDHGRVVHDGSIEALHARYGSRRRVVVELDEPVQSPPSGATGGSGLAGSGTVLPAATVEADGRHLVFEVDGSAAQVIAGLPGLRDLSIVEPDIEDAAARLYAAPDR